MIDLIILGLSFVMFLVYVLVLKHRIKTEKDLIELVRSMSLYLDKGHTLEEAFRKTSKDQTNTAAKHFRKVLAMEEQGSQFETALHLYADKFGSKTFSYLAHIMIEGNQKEISETLRDVLRHMIHIKDVQEDIVGKAHSSILTLKIFGVILLPIIYYFMSVITGVEMMNYMLLYLGIVVVAMVLLDFTILGDVVGSLMFLPFAATMFYVVVTMIGPFLVENFGSISFGLV